jgi:hypothetical protein
MPDRATGASDRAAETLTLTSVPLCRPGLAEMFNAERPRAMRLHRAKPSQLSVAGWPSSTVTMPVVRKRWLEWIDKTSDTPILDHRQQYTGPRGIIFTPLI